MEYSQRRKIYIKVYLGAFFEYDIKPAEGLLLFTILSLSKKEGYCYASRKGLARMIGASQPTVYSLLSKLIKKGLIQKAGISDRRTVKLEVSDEVKSFVRSVHAEVNGSEL